MSDLLTTTLTYSPKTLKINLQLHYYATIVYCNFDQNEYKYTVYSTLRVHHLVDTS